MFEKQVPLPEEVCSRLDITTRPESPLAKSSYPPIRIPRFSLSERLTKREEILPADTELASFAGKERVWRDAG